LIVWNPLRQKGKNKIALYTGTWLCLNISPLCNQAFLLFYHVAKTKKIEEYRCQAWRKMHVLCFLCVVLHFFFVCSEYFLSHKALSSAVFLDYYLSYSNFSSLHFCLCFIGLLVLKICSVTYFTCTNMLIFIITVNMSLFFICVYIHK